MADTPVTQNPLETKEPEPTQTPSEPTNTNNTNNNDNKDKEENGSDYELDSEDEKLIERMIAATINPQESESEEEKETQPAANVLSSVDIEGIADLIKSGQAKNIIVMTGAGVSVAAGIPDFRTPGTGLYYNLQKYNLPEPSDVFDIEYFREKPDAFYMLAKELYPGNFVPTYCHYFIRLLHEKGILLRNYTQNIDTLERIAKIPPEQLVEAHGTFGTAHCITCKYEYDSDFVKDAVFKDTIPRCTSCNGLVKPDIVFFGEGLPERFHDLLQEDFPLCDLLIVIGTSLKVQPFASLVRRVFPTVPRLLINMEAVGEASFMDFIMSGRSGGFKFNTANGRDVKLLGECQAGVKKLAELIGWGEELENLYARESKIVLENSPVAKANAEKLNAEKSNSNSNSDLGKVEVAQENKEQPVANNEKSAITAVDKSEAEERSAEST